MRSCQAAGIITAAVKRIMTDEELFKNRIFDLATRADTQFIYTYSRFLTPLEQSSLLSMRGELPVPVTLFGGTESAIRKIAVFGSEDEFGYPFEDPIRILHIRPKSEKFSEELSHRDYLGSLMALGIERELTGDIIVRGKEAWVFCLDSIVSFLCESLSQIRHTNVICEEVEGDVPELAPEFQALHLNTASERIDLIVAGAAGINREAAKKLLADDKVFINGRAVSSAGHKLNEGDELVIRGFGKFIYDGVASTSRKGRCNISLLKYI